MHNAVWHLIVASPWVIGKIFVNNRKDDVNVLTENGCLRNREGSTCFEALHFSTELKLS